MKNNENKKGEYDENPSPNETKNNKPFNGWDNNILKKILPQKINNSNECYLHENYRYSPFNEATIITKQNKSNDLYKKCKKLNKKIIRKFAENNKSNSKPKKLLVRASSVY